MFWNGSYSHGETGFRKYDKAIGKKMAQATESQQWGFPNQEGLKALISLYAIFLKLQLSIINYTRGGGCGGIREVWIDVQ